MATSGDVEFRYAQAGSTSAIIGGLKDDQLRIYKSSTLTISSARSIQKIAITAVLNKSIGADGLESAGYTAAEDKLSGVWEGNANSVTLTASKGQCRITQIVVTLEDGIERGGFGESVSDYYKKNNSSIKCLVLAHPDKFSEHTSETAIYKNNGIKKENILNMIEKCVETLE